MRKTILGFAVLSLLCVACDKVQEPLAVPVPQDPGPAAKPRVSQTEITAAEVKAEQKAEPTKADEPKADEDDRSE